LIGDGVKMVGDYVECGLGGRSVGRIESCLEKEQRGREVAKDLSPDTSMVHTQRQLSYHHRVLFLVRFIHRRVHGYQLRPAAATPLRGAILLSLELRVRDKRARCSPEHSNTHSTPHNIRHHRSRHLIHTAQRTHPYPSPPSPRPLPTDTAVSLATCSDPTPARLAFLPPMQGLCCQPIAAALA
jgi:hypothetical protein